MAEFVFELASAQLSIKEPDRYKGFRLASISEMAAVGAFDRTLNSNVWSGMDQALAY